ncbi:MAG: hypothetical protein EON48_01895 [Acetobacteraceae bacterium]|nr:MAG: hypothetical protein EON48_01895 [Acetobacteraceae bacterium]
MPTHSGSLPHRFALFTGLARKPKVAATPATKASTTALSQRPARVQAATPQLAGRFAHLNTGNTAGLATLLQPEKRASTPQRRQPQQDLGSQMLASISEAMQPTRRAAAATPHDMAASILATSRKLQPGRF